jgi:hypothetical protein
MSAHVRKVEPDVPVKPDSTGAASLTPQKVANGMLYAPETKEQAKVVPAEPKHICNPPEPYSKIFSDEEESANLAKQLPRDTLFHCECGEWLKRDIYHHTYAGRWSHYWVEVSRWDFKTKRRIKEAEAQEHAQEIMDLIDKIDASL